MPISRDIVVQFRDSVMVSDGSVAVSDVVGGGVVVVAGDVIASGRVSVVVVSCAVVSFGDIVFAMFWRQPEP